MPYQLHLRPAFAALAVATCALVSSLGAQQGTGRDPASRPSVQGAQPATPTPAPSRPAATVCGAAACAFDAYDPRYFLDVVEITRNGERLPIHLASHARALTKRDGAKAAAKDSAPRFSQEVSHNGSIALRFDREYLRSMLGGDGFATTMTIRGEYIRGGKVEKLEVPGYSEVGQEARQSRITAIALLPMRMTRAIREFTDLHSRVESQIALAVSRLAPGTKSARGDSLAISLRSQVDSLAAVSRRETALFQQLERAMREPSVPRVSSGDPQASDTVDANEVMLRQLRQARTSRAVADSTVRAVRLQFEALVEQQARAGYEIERARTTAAAYLAARDQLLALTDRLSGGSDTLAQNLSAVLVNREPASMVAQGRRMREAMAALHTAYEAATSGDDAQRTAATRTLDYLNDSIHDLLVSFARLDPPLSPDGQLSSAVSDLLLREFADPTIALMATPVEPGDDVRLIVVSTPKDQGAVRQYSIRVKIVDFGFNERKRDVSSLIRRFGVNARDNERRVEQFLGDKKKGELFVSDAVLYQPAVGAVFGWQWVPRKSNKALTFVRWMAPSIGLHVSTPQFGAKIYRFEEDSGTVKIEERKNVTDVGLGISMGFWDDKVIVTRGWAITAIEKKSYFSLGLSLISLADGALSLAKSAP